MGNTRHLNRQLSIPVPILSLFVFLSGGENIYRVLVWDVELPSHPALSLAYIFIPLLEYIIYL